MTLASRRTTTTIAGEADTRRGSDDRPEAKPSAGARPRCGGPTALGRSARMRRVRAALLAAAFLSVADFLGAQDVTSSLAPPRRPLDLSIAVRASTLGLGGEIAKLVGGHAAVRVGAHFASYEGGDVEDATKIKLQNFSALLDLFPARRGSFRLTGGLVAGTTSVALSEGPEFYVGDDENAPLHSGTLTETYDYPSARPYAGFGWGTPASRRGGFGFVSDIGVAFGKPRYSIDATGPDANSAQLRAELAAEREKNQEDIDAYAFYPVIGFGLSYRF